MKYSIFYHLVKNDFEDFLSAGILAENEAGKEIRRIFDVSTDFKALEELVNSLNDGEIAIIHLDSILEDYYTEHY